MDKLRKVLNAYGISFEKRERSNIRERKLFSYKMGELNKEETIKDIGVAMLQQCKRLHITDYNLFLKSFQIDGEQKKLLDRRIKDNSYFEMGGEFYFIFRNNREIELTIEEAYPRLNLGEEWIVSEGFLSQVVATLIDEEIESIETIKVPEMCLERQLKGYGIGLMDIGKAIEQKEYDYGERNYQMNPLDIYLAVNKKEMYVQDPELFLKSFSLDQKIEKQKHFLLKDAELWSLMDGAYNEEYHANLGGDLTFPIFERLDCLDSKVKTILSESDEKLYQVFLSYLFPEFDIVNTFSTEEAENEMLRRKDVVLGEVTNVISEIDLKEKRDEIYSRDSNYVNNLNQLKKTILA